MAKRRKKSSSRRRSRRIGAIGGSILPKVGGVVVGAVAANFVDKLLPIQNEAIKGGAKVALGIFLPKLAKGTFVESVGYGMIAVGGVQLAKGVLPAGTLGEAPLLIAGMDTVGEIETIGNIDTVGEIPTVGEVPMEDED